MEDSKKVLIIGHVDHGNSAALSEAITRAHEEGKPTVIVIDPDSEDNVAVLARGHGRRQKLKNTIAALLEEEEKSLLKIKNTIIEFDDQVHINRTFYPNEHAKSKKHKKRYQK